MYLRGPGSVPTNIAGFVLPYDARIVAIGAATDGSETWTAEVRKNNVATALASLNITASDKGSTGPLSVDVNADDEIQIFCNGTNVDSPQVTVYLIWR